MRVTPPPRGQQLLTILMMTAMLVWIVVARQRCGQGAASMFRSLEGRPPAHVPDGGRP